MEAKLESAKRRYGIPPVWVRAYHACSSGLVEESRKYGSPTVTLSRARMVSDGCPKPCVFQATPGMMGRVARLTTRTEMWVRACFRGASVFSQCAYRYPSR